MTTRPICTIIAASSLMLTTPAAASPTTIWEVLTVDRIATVVAQSMISMLRTVTNVTYVDLDVSPLDGRIVLSGLQISPIGAPECLISVDRALITTAPLDQIEISSLDVDLIGVEMTDDCIPASDRRELAEIGLTEFALDRVELRLNYTFSSGALDLDFQAVSSNMADMRGNADFSYFAIQIDDDEPALSAVLNRAEIEVTDQGLWAILAPQFPTAIITNPDVLSEMLRDELLTGTDAPVPTEDKDEPTTGPDGPTGNSAQLFLDDLASAIAGFANEPGRLSLTLSPDAPIELNEDLFDSFEGMVTLVRPAISNAETNAVTRITPGDAEMIMSWANGDDIDIPRADQLRFAQAFLTGIGAPRDAQAAMQILTPLLEDGDADAIDMALGTLDDLDPGFAYRIAHHAAALGNRAAFAQLDRLERMISLDEMGIVQSDAAAAPTLTGEESPADLRNQGYAALTGLGAPRNYANAYFYGLVALASGDLAAESLIDEIEAMAARADEGDAGDWQNMIDTVQSDARAHWFALPR